MTELAARAKELLSYDPETGVFTWVTTRKGQPPKGSVAGTTDSKGYRRIRIDRVEIKSHRLAWLFVYGHWPSGQIDHIDGDRQNNKINNLREATAAQNKQNMRKAQSNSKTGILGVVWNVAARKWCASIRVNGVKKHLGSFDSPEEARAAYLKAKADIHPFAIAAMQEGE